MLIRTISKAFVNIIIYNINGGYKMKSNQIILKQIFSNFYVEHDDSVPSNVGIYKFRHEDFPGRFVKIYVGCEKQYSLTNRRTPFLKDVSGILCINSDEMDFLTTCCDRIKEISYISTSELSENGYVKFNDYLMTSDDVEGIWYSQLS